MTNKTTDTNNEMCKKIYPLWERFVCILVALIFSVPATVLLVNYSNSTAWVIVAYACILFAVASLVKLLAIPSHIIIWDSRVKVYDFPPLATNRFYNKKRSLISYNGEIPLDEVEKIEVVTLTKKEQQQFVGYKHLTGKYLKFTMKYGNSKYVYVGNYSARQIDNIIRLAMKNKVTSN